MNLDLLKNAQISNQPMVGDWIKFANQVEDSNDLIVEDQVKEIVWLELPKGGKVCCYRTRYNFSIPIDKILSFRKEDPLISEQVKVERKVPVEEIYQQVVTRKLNAFVTVAIGLLLNSDSSTNAFTEEQNLKMARALLNDRLRILDEMKNTI